MGSPGKTTACTKKKSTSMDTGPGTDEGVEGRPVSLHEHACPKLHPFVERFPGFGQRGLVSHKASARARGNAVVSTVTTKGV